MVGATPLYVGLDLGMINSVLAFTDDSGQLNIQHWEEGMSKMPTAVLLTPSGSYAGYPAVNITNHRTKHYLETCFKRMMGTGHRLKIFETDYTVIEIYAMVLKKMLNVFEREHQCRVEKVAIAVPANFGDSEREAVLMASKLCGIKQTELINEADAAAIAYCSDDPDFNGDIMIYDLGGGTFDVTVINVEEKGFTVLANDGSRFLGGRDWDLHLASIIQKKVVDQSGISPVEMDRDYDLRKRILMEAERQKIILDRVDSSTGNIEIKGRRYDFTVTRNELDSATLCLVNRTVKMMESTMKNAGVNPSDLSRIVMVGGPSITPLIRKALEEAYPSSEIIRYDPIHAVAKGAAIYAKSVFKDKNLNLTSVLSMTYGLKMGVDGQETVCNILYRNVHLPISRSETCRPKADDQKELAIEVYENKAVLGEPFTDLMQSRLVTSLNVPLEGRISRGKTKIFIDMTADYDGMITINVTCNGKTIKCSLSPDSEITNEEFLASAKKIMMVE